jgi:hypothetical protein
MPRSSLESLQMLMIRQPVVIAAYEIGMSKIILPRLNPIRPVHFWLKQLQLLRPCCFRAFPGSGWLLVGASRGYDFQTPCVRKAGSIRLLSLPRGPLRNCKRQFMGLSTSRHRHRRAGITWLPSGRSRKSTWHSRNPPPQPRERNTIRIVVVFGAVFSNRCCSGVLAPRRKFLHRLYGSEINVTITSLWMDGSISR